MFQKLFRLSSITAIAILCIYCISNPKTEIQYHGEKSKLSTEIFEKLDYKVKEFGESQPGDWHKTQFQTVWQRSYFVKRNTSVKESEKTYPRFHVREEVYETEDLAAKRIKRIEEKPPEFINEEYWIVTGFQHQKNVYFIRTDSVLFSYYMKDFADKLAAEIQK
jgi:hypothetical protein